jgi:anaerobic ribonucleoside-triphosphate reductase activating protein
MATEQMSKEKNPQKFWAEDRSVLHLASRTDRCTVLGPGRRAVLWVQGCPFRCPGCVAPETQAFRGGESVDVASLAEELSRLSDDIEGLTFSQQFPVTGTSGVGLVLLREVSAIR